LAVHRRSKTLLQGLWLVGGEQKDANALLEKAPAVRAAHPVLIPQDPFATAYSREMNVSEGAPSTGFVGVCEAPQTQLLAANTRSETIQTKFEDWSHPYPFLDFMLFGNKVFQL